MMVYGLSSLRYAHAGYTAASTISRPSRYSRTEIALRFLPAKSQVVSYSICLQPLSSGHCWNNSLTQSTRSEEHTSELQSRENLVCRLLLEKKKKLKEQKTQ